MNCLCGVYLLFAYTFHVVTSERVHQDSRSIGGYNVDLNSTSKWPWLVAFVTRENDKFFCAGTLIGRQHVLSGLSSRYNVVRFSHFALSCTLFPSKKFSSQNRIRLALRSARAIGFGQKWKRRVNVRCERDFHSPRLES